MTEPGHALRPILLTGLPRCGSSWVGERVSRAPGVRYRYESLNADWVPSLKGRLAHFRYQPPDTPGPMRLRRAADRAFAGRQSMRQYARALYRGYTRATLRRHGTLVLKDPTACLLAAWLEARHACRVVVLVRHPCGFASSIRGLDWPLRLRRLLAQRRLVREHLEPFLPVLEDAAHDPWASLGAFWGAVHLVLRRQAGPDWTFLGYEALCLEPETAFGTLADATGLDLPRTRSRDGHRHDPASTVKDSRRMAGIWRERMGAADVAAVLRPVEELGLLPWLESELAQPSA